MRNLDTEASATLERLEHFKKGTGPYAPKRAKVFFVEGDDQSRSYSKVVDQEERERKHRNAMGDLRKSRDSWKRRAMQAEKALATLKARSERTEEWRERQLVRFRMLAEALRQLAVLFDSRGIYFAAKKLQGEIDGY